MKQLSTLLTSLAKNISNRNGNKSRFDGGVEAADAWAKKAKRNELVLTSSGIVNAKNNHNVVAAYSKRGKKGVNQDSFIVWEEFGCQEDMTFCGVFDGHGPWGHLVAKKVRELMPSSLLCYWQEAVAQNSLNMNDSLGLGADNVQSDIWKQSYLKTCSAVDQELQHHPGIDAFYSGTAALALVRQGNHMTIANIGDSRAVLASSSDDGSLVAIQLTIDLKPNLPHESKRIIKSSGKVFSCPDEPGVYRIWMPDGQTVKGPGLALSRAFGDYCMKDFGLISEPEITQRNINSRDQFVILASDGVWDVISNQEAIEIVASTPERGESAKRLVESAVSAWKCKKGKATAMDDISAICFFFHCQRNPLAVNSMKLNKRIA